MEWVQKEEERMCLNKKRRKRNFEKNIVDKCKDQPKLFYKIINGKLKNRD